VIAPSIVWSQDDFDLLIDEIFTTYTQLSKLEVINGADRATVRCSWSGHYFYLQFECYIETIWFEPCDQLSEQSLADLANYLQCST